MKRLILVALAITGILAAGCIVRYGSLYTDNNDTSHFVGLASNLSKVDVISASVKVDFYDASNHLLDSKVVNPCTRTLQIGNNSPFEAVPNDGVVADHVQTTVQWLTLGHKTAADVDVNTDNIAVSTDSGETHITGMVDANEGPQERERLRRPAKQLRRCRQGRRGLGGDHQRHRQRPLRHRHDVR